MLLGLLLADFLPRGENFPWSMSLTVASVVADALAAAAFLAIPIALVRAYRRRRDERNHLGLLVLGGFVVVCGAACAIDIWNIWHADPVAAVAVKMVLGLAAATAAIYLLRSQPQALDPAGAHERERLNLALAQQLEELTRTTAALRVSEEMFRTFMDNSPALAWVTDEAGVYRYVSQPFQRRNPHLGDLVGRSIAEVFPASFVERYMSDNRQVIAQQRSLEFVEPGEDGTEYQVFKFPLRDAEGRPLIGGIAFDITEQRRIRDSLRQQSELHATMGESLRVYLESGDWRQAFGLLLRGALRQTQSEIGFVGVILSGSRLRILAHEQVDWEQHFGREFRDAPRSPLAEHGCVEFTRLDNLFVRAIRSGEVVMAGPAVADRRPGDPAPRHPFIAMPVLREKQVVGLIGVGHRPGGYDGPVHLQLEPVMQQAGLLCDSYRRELREASLEEQLRAAQKMEAVGLLAGGVAHDFNNLLQVIQGYTNLALDTGSPWPERRASLEQVRHASERAAQLTQQLLAFGRRQNLQKTDLDVNAAIGELLRMIRRLIGEQITVDFIPGHELGNVQADRGQIDQVLLNLCLNARDALGNGGRITIETENVFVNGTFRESHPWAKPGRYALITVSDNGIGMDRETSARIFEPFFTTKGKDKGTGLGLSVVYGVVKQHEGMVHVYSEPGKGTTFKIYLPIVARSASTVGPKHTPVHSRGTETILLAEDEPMVRDLAQRILTRAGYRVLLASDGSEACTLFAKHAHEIALVILDVVMPQIGGREVYERLAQQSPGLPVIFCSGYAGSALGADVFGVNSARLLAKPYGADEMLESVRMALDRR